MPLGSRAAAWRRVDAGVVDNRVHAADRIYLLCNAVDLGRASQVTDYDPSGLGCEVGKRRGALGRSCMKDDLMVFIEKRPRRRATEPIGLPVIKMRAIDPRYLAENPLDVLAIKWFLTIGRATHYRTA